MEKLFGIVHMDITPGTTDFRERAIACVEAIRPDFTGTTAYEWFLNEDGTKCTVLEIYDGPEAIALHSKMVGPAVMAVKDVAAFALEFAGDVPQGIADRMRERLGAVEVLGRRFQGRLTEASSNKIGDKAGTMIFAIARFTIHPGKQAEFCALAEECFARVVANEPGTIGYEWFLDADERVCLTIDVYEDEKALGAHMMNAGPVMAQILKIVDSDTTVYGNISEGMRAKFKPELGVRYGAPQICGIL